MFVFQALANHQPKKNTVVNCGITYFYNDRNVIEHFVFVKFTSENYVRKWSSLL